MHLNSRMDFKKASEEDLIAACRKSDRVAQKELYDRLAPRMLAVCKRYMGDAEQALDILQEGFVTLFTKLDSYSGTGSFEGWARKIFVNTALMSLRKHDVMKESEELDTAFGVSADSPSPVQEIGYKELTKLISSLPTGYRTVFNMYAVEGYSHKEIGEALGITEATSRSQLQRARMMLQDMIRKRQ